MLSAKYQDINNGNEDIKIYGIDESQKTVSLKLQ
jgi:hypothetical protein